MSLGQLSGHLGIALDTCPYSVVLYDEGGPLPSPLLLAIAHRLYQEGRPVKYLQGRYTQHQYYNEYYIVIFINEYYNEYYIVIFINEYYIIVGCSKSSISLFDPIF